MNNPLVTVDPGLYVWTIVTFLVLALLLRAFAWKPLMAALEQRQQTIAAALEDARKAREDLQRVQQDAAALLAEARREADGILTRTRADAERLRAELRTQAQTEAANIGRNAEKQIQQETARAVAQIRQEAVDLSIDIASKILRRTVTKEDHAHLISDVVERLDGPTH